MYMTVSAGVWTPDLQEATLAWLGLGDELTCVASLLF